MPYAVLEKEIEKLDETQRHTVVLFARFLLAQKSASVPAVCDGEGRKRKCDFSNLIHAEKVPLFGSLKDKLTFIAPDFDEPLDDFAEYM